MKISSIMTIAALVVTFAGSELYAGANEARNIQRVSVKAKNLVNRILSRGPSRPAPGVGQPGIGQPGTGQPGIINPGRPGGIRFPWENDALALPMFMQSSSQLNTAANYAFESLNYYLSGNISMGNFKFVSACGRLATAKSALARANFAALQPPVGAFGVFNPEVLNMLNEIETARTTNGCL